MDSVACADFPTNPRPHRKINLLLLVRVLPHLFKLHPHRGHLQPPAAKQHLRVTHGQNLHQSSVDSPSRKSQTQIRTNGTGVELHHLLRENEGGLYGAQVQTLVPLKVSLELGLCQAGVPLL